MTHADVQLLQTHAVLADGPQTLVCEVRPPHPAEVNLAQVTAPLLHDLSQNQRTQGELNICSLNQTFQLLFHVQVLSRELMSKDKNSSTSSLLFF